MECFPNSTLYFDIRKKICDYCKSEKNDLKICSKCKLCRYCDKECQVKDWPVHKRRCKTPGESTRHEMDKMLGFALKQAMQMKKFKKMYGFDLRL